MGIARMKMTMAAVVMAGGCVGAVPGGDPDDDGAGGEPGEAGGAGVHPGLAGGHAGGEPPIEEPADPWSLTTPLPPGTCAPPLPDVWTGTSSIEWGSPGYHQSFDAEVTWTRVETTGCVDRYLPSGTLTYDIGHSAACSPPAQSGPITAGDGELVIDRSVEPPTYTMRGLTLIPFSLACDGEPPGPLTPQGGKWADQRGVVAGRTIGGGRIRFYDSINDHRWRFVPADATFTPCAEPAADRWLSMTEASEEAAPAWLTWTRVSTVGCVDTFAPSEGVVRILGDNCQYAPDSGPVESADGVLTIDRGATPPTFHVTGHSRWDTVITCQHPGDPPTTRAGQAHTTWARVEGIFEGGAFGGELRHVYSSVPGTGPRYSWRFLRP
jgi:hypothetical protein